MLGPTPRFPAFDVWQTMSESEQDALLAKMETARRRASLGYRLVIGLACTTLGAAIGFALLRFW
jgi:hypothetical protein